MTTLTGTLQGNTITLDTMTRSLRKKSTQDGQRVRVSLEPLEDKNLVLSAEQQTELLRDWAEHGPQGPIENEGDT